MSVHHSGMTPTEVRLGLWRNGYHSLPLNFKNPNIRTGWQNGFTLNEGEIELWAKSWPNATNTGILTRHTPVLDIDILDKEAAEAAEALVAEQTGSDYILVRIGLPPKRAIPFRTDVPFAKISVTLIAANGEEHKIEFLGDGQQAVVDGIHPDTHAPYSWHGGSPIEVPRSDLPSIDGPAAHKLVDDIVELLIEQHGYRRKTKEKPKSGNGTDGADWDSFFNNTIDHDQLAASAMALLRSGMSDGAVVNFLRAAVRNLKGVDEDRRQRRLDEIPGLVSTARRKLDDEKPPPPPGGLGEWSAGADPGPIRPRQWLLGNQFCGGYISSLFAAGGVGKSVLRLLQFISMALDRPLCGQHVFRRSRVLLISLEDNDDELQRRIHAVLLHYGIERSELEGWMWCSAPIGRKIALQGHKSPVVGDLEKQIRDAIALRQPDTVALDPFVKLHSLEENDSGDMNFVCDLLTKIATENNIAVDIPHHVHKGQIAPGDADAGRGSSGIRDAGRLIYTLTVMSETEAKSLNIKPDERFSYVRLDSAKVNIASRANAAAWFRIVGVPIGNSTPEYPAGDTVQVAEPWSPPDAWKGLSTHTLNAILDGIDAGCVDEDGHPTGERYTNAPAATDRAVWPVVQKFAPDKSEAQCRTIINAWLRSGLLFVKPYDSPSQRKKRNGLCVDNAKRPGTYTTETASSDDFF